MLGKLICGYDQMRIIRRITVLINMSFGLPGSQTIKPYGDSLKTTRAPKWKKKNDSVVFLIDDSCEVLCVMLLIKELAIIVTLCTLLSSLSLA